MKKKTLFIILIQSIILVVIIALCLTYLLTYYGAKGVDKYLLSNQDVEVIDDKDFIFFDNKSNNDKVFIFYPGAKVDEKAYSLIIRGIADSGVDCFIVKMPFHMAIFDTNKADVIYNKYKYKDYYIGGHSMGGAMAAKYASTTKNDLKGLIFYAAYTIYDLKNKDIDILTIYGTNDGVLKAEKIEKEKEYVNVSRYNEIKIEGGNHAQFGSYGEQSGDKKATISLEKQTEIVVKETSKFIFGQ